MVWRGWEVCAGVWGLLARVGVRGEPPRDLLTPGPAQTLAVKQLIRNLLKTDPTQRMTITEFMNHPWIMVRQQGGVGVRTGQGWDGVPAAPGSRSPALSAAIHAGAADPAAHQPGAERGEGSVGGREGKTSLCCRLKCSVPRGPAAGCPIPPARCDLGSFGLGASVLAPGEICAWEGTGEMGSGTLLLL